MVTPAERLNVQYSSYFSATTALAQSLNYLGKMNQALTILRAAVQLARDFDFSSMNYFELLETYAEVLMARYFQSNAGWQELADLVHKIHQRAERQYNEQGMPFEMNTKTMQIARAYSLLGQAYYYQTLNTAALDHTAVQGYLKQAAGFWEKVEPEQPIFADVMSGELDSTQILQIKATGTSKALMFLALSHQRLGEDEQGKEYNQRALDLALQVDAKEVASYIYRHLTWLVEDPEQKLEYALNSLRLREEIGFKRLLPHSHLLVSDLFLEQGTLEIAQEHCQAALQLAKEMDLPSALMMIFRTQGDIYQRQGLKKEARTSFDNMLDFAEKLDLAYGVVQAEKRLKEL